MGEIVLVWPVKQASLCQAANSLMILYRFGFYEPWWLVDIGMIPLSPSSPRTISCCSGVTICTCPAIAEHCIPHTL